MLLVDTKPTAKRLRERSTAQRRRQDKRDEEHLLETQIQLLEQRRVAAWTQLSSLLPPNVLREVLAEQRAATEQLQRFACRLCSSTCPLTVEFASVDDLVRHQRLQHANDLRARLQRRRRTAIGPLELVAFATELPPETGDDDDGDSDSGDDDDEDEEKEEGENAEEQRSRRLRLQRNAASARKSRRRKRGQLERSRMLVPQLRFQVNLLETALASSSSSSSSLMPVMVKREEEEQVEPDVLHAARALLSSWQSASWS